MMWELSEDYSAGTQPLMQAMVASGVGACGPSPTPTATVTGCAACSPTFTPSPSPPASPVPCTVLINGCETLAENGTWSGANATRSIVNNPALAVTQGYWAMKVAVTTANNWNDAVARLSGP